MSERKRSVPQRDAPTKSRTHRANTRTETARGTGGLASERNRLRRPVLAILLTLLAAAPLFAHPYHTSIGEADWNPETKRLEVALRFVPDDFDRALRAHAGPPSPEATTEEVDRQIVDWLAQGFRVLEDPESDAPAPIQWVGKEVSIEHVWLYFEVPLPKGLYQATLEHRLLLDLEPTQTNTLLLRIDGQRRTLTFGRGRFQHHLGAP